jgi:hypothetical protein
MASTAQPVWFPQWAQVLSAHPMPPLRPQVWKRAIVEFLVLRCFEWNQRFIESGRL